MRDDVDPEELTATDSSQQRDPLVLRWKDKGLTSGKMRAFGVIADIRQKQGSGSDKIAWFDFWQMYGKCASARLAGCR